MPFRARQACPYTIYNRGVKFPFGKNKLDNIEKSLMSKNTQKRVDRQTHTSLSLSGNGSDVDMPLTHPQTWGGASLI